MNWCGMASQPIFYKDLLEKIGIKMQVFKVGSYKSAVEPFTATQMSDANREQVTSYLNDIWQTMLTDVSRSRSIKKDLLNEYADSMLTFRSAEELVRNGMVDSLCYIDGISRMLRAKTGKDKGALPLVSVKELAAATEATPKEGDKIAVYYAYGDIVDRKTEWSENVIDAETVCRDLRTLREDESVKAVVFRVNSGGGSAYASEQIWHEVKLLREAKPVVVSMGGMAASGGYYLRRQLYRGRTDYVDRKHRHFRPHSRRKPTAQRQIRPAFRCCKDQCTRRFRYACTPIQSFGSSNDARIYTTGLQIVYRTCSRRTEHENRPSGKTGRRTGLDRTAGRGKRIGRCQRQPPDRHQKGCFISQNKRLPYGIRTDSVPLVRGFV